MTYWRMTRVWKLRVDILFPTYILQREQQISMIGNADAHSRDT